MQLPFEYVTEDFVEELKLLEPFGTGNEKPLFAEKDIKVVYYNVFGKNNNVLKLRLRNQNGSMIDGIMFGSEQEIAAKSAELENAGFIYILSRHKRVPRDQDSAGADPFTDLPQSGCMI